MKAKLLTGTAPPLQQRVLYTKSWWQKERQGWVRYTQPVLSSDWLTQDNQPMVQGSPDAWL